MTTRPETIYLVRHQEGYQIGPYFTNLIGAQKLASYHLGAKVYQLTEVVEFNMDRKT